MFGFNKCFVIVRSSDVNKVSKILSIVFYSDLRLSLHAMPTLFLSTACCLSCKIYNLIVITLLSVYNADSFYLNTYFIAYNRSFFFTFKHKNDCDWSQIFGAYHCIYFAFNYTAMWSKRNKANVHCLVYGREMCRPF